MTGQRLTEAFRLITDDVVVPAPDPDLWRRGRRRRRIRITAAGCAVAVLVSVPAVPLLAGWSGRPPTPPAEPTPVVPSTVYAPLPGQRDVRDDPPGPATLIVSGEGPFRGSDVLGGYEGRTVVVGRDGRYRLVDGADEGEVGSAFHLSPDGRYLAASGPVDGAEDLAVEATALVDLSTGRVRGLPHGLPVGWAPDGRLLVRHGTAGLRLLGVGTGEIRSLPLAVGGGDRLVAAFSADGRRLAVEVGDRLRILDLVSGAEQVLPRRVGSRLAGAGAWTPDGRLAVWDLVSGCAEGCELPMPGVGEFRLTLRDPDPDDNRTPGTDADPGSEPGSDGGSDPGFGLVDGQLPRLLGWLPDGSAVVRTYRPQTPAADDAGGAELVALRPDGGRARLVDLPASAHDVDVARDLLLAGRFGGTPPPLTDRLLDWLAGMVGQLVWIGAVVVAVTVARRLWRRLRRALARRPPRTD